MKWTTHLAVHQDPSPSFRSQTKRAGEEIFQKLVEVGTKDIFIEHRNLSSYIRGRLMEEMKDVSKRYSSNFTRHNQNNIERVRRNDL